jgi:hypothetical protein
MADGADERKQAPEAAESATPEPGESAASVTVAEERAAPEAALSGAAQPGGEDRADEVIRQATQPIPVVQAEGADGDLDQTLPDVRMQQLRAQAAEEMRLLRAVLGERANDPGRAREGLSQVVTREAILRLLGERVTCALPPSLLAIWRHEVLVAHWRAFAALEEWSAPVSRAWERTGQQLEELFQQLERWLPDHPYVDEVINLADDIHSPARWFRRFLLKSERSFSQWLQPVVESEEVMVDVLALARYATSELERALAWYTLQRTVLETEVQPDQMRVIELLGGVRAITELIREAFGGRGQQVRLLGLSSGASGGGRLELELARRLGKDWRLMIRATDPDTLTALRSLAGARLAFLQAQMRGELAPESTFEMAEARPYELSAWEAGTFDLVVMVGGLHHLRLSEQARCLVEAQRVGRLVMFLEPLHGEEERMEAFCRPLVRAGEQEPALLAQLSGWARRALGRTGERMLLHASGAYELSVSYAQALTLEEMARLVAESGTNYTVRALDAGKSSDRPQWLAIVGSSG